LNITREGTYNLTKGRDSLITDVQHMGTDRELTEEELYDADLQGEKLNIVTEDYDKLAKMNDSIILEFQHMVTRRESTVDDLGRRCTTGREIQSR
jgi:phage FluMu protein gp41